MVNTKTNEKIFIMYALILFQTFFIFSYSTKAISNEDLYDEYMSQAEQFYYGNDYLKAIEVYKMAYEVSFKKPYILLQIGADFCGAGVQTVSIKRDDLKSLNFDNCKFEYSCD